MRLNTTTNTARLMLIAAIAMLLVFAAPLLAAAAPSNSAGSQGKGGQAPKAAYPLNGDDINGPGSSFTEFHSTYASIDCVWCFYADSPTTDTVALAGIITTTAANSIGVRGWSSGTGVQGLQLACGCAAPLAVDAGVQGYSDSAYGVYGSSDGDAGVVGESADFPGVSGSSSIDVGVLGTSDSFIGVAGFTLDGVGVDGESINDLGIYGLSYNPDFGSVSVVGDSLIGSNTVGVLGFGGGPAAGVFGITDGGIGDPVSGGVEGFNDQFNGGSLSKNAGVYGHCATCMGVIGLSDNFIGVKGVISGTNSASYGGYFTNTAGIALYGRSAANEGVRGSSTSSYGVRAVSASSYGMLATSTSSVGVRGSSQTYYGSYIGSDSGSGGYSYTKTGLTGFRAHNDTTTAGHYGLISDGDVLVNGNLTCTGSCLLASSVKTSGGEKLVYGDSSAQSVVSDQGSAMLKDGRAVIKIDALFAQAVSLDGGYQVFLTPASFASAGLAVGNKTGASFEVRELNGGKGNYSFDWRLTAVRRGYEKTRLADAPSVAAPATEPDLPAFSDPGAAAAPIAPTNKAGHKPNSTNYGLPLEDRPAYGKDKGKTK